LSQTISGKLQATGEAAGSGDEIVANTVFLDGLADDMKKLDAYFAEKASFVAAYDVKRIQNLILVSFNKLVGPLFNFLIQYLDQGYLKTYSAYATYIYTT
jgi:hypothetical protein